METEPLSSNALRILVLDWPNLEARMIEILGRRPGPQERPSLAALASWFSNRLQAGETGDAVVFANVPTQITPGFQRWAHRLRSRGYGLYAKPRANGADIDPDLIQHVQRMLAAGTVSEVVVVSSDLYRDHQICGKDPLESFADLTQVTVVGFSEKVARYASAHPKLAFVDPAEIPGLLPEEIASRRRHIAALPASGILLRPFAPLAPQRRAELASAA